MFRKISYIRDSVVLCVFGFIGEKMYTVSIFCDGEISYTVKQKFIGDEKQLHTSKVCDRLFEMFLQGRIQEEKMPLF